MTPEMQALLLEKYVALGQWRRFLRSDRPISPEARAELIRMLDMLEEAMAYIGEVCS